MSSGGAYGSRVGDAHAAGDLHVHGFDGAGGYWASWDTAAVAGRGDVAVFVSKASREWHGFQRLEGFETLNRRADSVMRLVEGGTRVFLGFDEQTRRQSVDEVFSALRAMNSRLVVPLLTFTDGYDWGTTNDLAAFDAVNSLCSPVFVHRGEEAKAFEPWSGGVALGKSGGVLGMVTLNLPRAAYESGKEDEFYGRVEELTELAVEGLDAKRSRLDEELKGGKMPATSTIVDSFDNFACAVGVVGMNEALQNLVERGIGSMQGKVIAYRTLELMRGIVKERGEATGHSFCLAAEPSDGAAYRLAALDRAKHPEIKTAGVDAAFYTGSTCLPVGYSDDLWDALEHQRKLQTFYTGGTVFNITPDRGIADAGGCKLLARRIVEKVGLPCFAFSSPVAVDGGGRFERAGYWYKLVSEMNAGEVEEVGLRRPFAVASGW